MNVVEEVPEEKGVDIKYGVNFFIKEVHIEKILLEGNLKSPDFKYVVEQVAISSDGKGNGVSSLKIYTEGDLIPFRMGNWKISPIIRMPFSWQGFWTEVEMVDSHGAIFIKKGRPDDASIFQHDGFFKEIKWAFETINNMASVFSAAQYELLELLSETDRRLNIYKGTVSNEKFVELFNQVNTAINKFQNLKGTLAPRLHIELKEKVNATIELFNNLLLEKVQ
jgi:hypothetical protein